MEQIAEIAARIRELREACGYTQEELAKELGIDVAVLRAYEENGYNIPISVIYQIANLWRRGFHRNPHRKRSPLGYLSDCEKGQRPFR